MRKTSAAYLEDGAENALAELGLSKHAFIGAALGAIGNAGRSALGNAGWTMARNTAIGAGVGGLAQGGIDAARAEEGQRGQAFLHGAGQGAAGGALIGAGTGMAQLGGAALASKAEGALGSAIKNNTGPAANRYLQQAVKGVPSGMAEQAALGAGFGAGLEGLISANSGPEDQRGENFLRGAAHGALSGSAMGAATGLTGGLAKNTGELGMHALAARQGLAGEAGQAAVKQVSQRGLGSTLRDVIQPARGGGAGAAPMGRAGAIAELANRGGNFLGNWVAPNWLVPGAITGAGVSVASQVPGRPEEAAKQASESPRKRERHPHAPDPVTLSTMLGSGLGGATTGFLGDLAQMRLGDKNPVLAKAINRYATIPGAVVGAGLGHYLGKNYVHGPIPFANLPRLKDIQQVTLQNS